MFFATLFIRALFFLMPIRTQAKFRFQKPGLEQSALASSRAEAVKEAFRLAYHDYIQLGYPMDEVAPLTKNGSNTRNGWGATLVDSLDTLFIMGLHDEFEQGLTRTAEIDFSRSYINQTVSIFETTIRYLGGILTAYELTGKKRKDLLDRACQLGHKLVYGWSRPSQKIPYGFLNFTTNQPIIDTSVVAEAGTLILEFDRLSHYSGNDTFRALADRAMKGIMDLPDHFPGLPALEIAPQNDSSVGDYITWGGGTDSYFEYLLKYAMLMDNRDPRYLEEWKKAVYSSITHLLRISNGHTYLASFSESRNGTLYVFSHLACFVGGNWLLGGKLIGDKKVIDIALQLINTCMHSYTSTETGLGPEVFRFLGPKGEVTGPKMNHTEQEFNKKHGFYITNPEYVLRPEVLESVFYAWRMTGDQRYQDFTWEAFQSLNKYCKAPASYAAIWNVTDARNVTQINDSESFLYAETFKYIYLTFGHPSQFSLDDYVFNTEAHPFHYTYHTDT
ncbi:hypothetical protein CROQUDRAFT_656215 [Cronartium quercuum f. sp. fusiforme G11]|uniref:alpha-1,2-Mannosidase n=1 Tax=Cronartium quercuum f. sp. fusiforme G11 TaxID=708437 RepID=A0A9P6TE11_9BASI|nr:hypothetical protein CROQUDRAFT_656215 [Cronartium quercuum f. sp. fusiforme G11]